MEIKFREAQNKDIKNLSILKQQVWISTYATEGIIDEFSDYVLSEYSTDKVKNSIEDLNLKTIIATIDKAIIGCVDILLKPQKPIKSVEPCIEISNLYILERFQGIGIGKRLLDECEKEIKQLDHNKIWLTVYFKNQNAIDFYHKHNFKHIGDWDFTLGESKHKNFIMLKNFD